MLGESNRERRELLNRLLERTQPEPPSVVRESEPQAIKPAFVPWRVRQQMLENEDKKRAQLTRDKEKEIADLERELGISEEQVK